MYKRVGVFAGNNRFRSLELKNGYEKVCLYVYWPSCVSQKLEQKLLDRFVNFAQCLHFFRNNCKEFFFRI